MAVGNIVRRVLKVIREVARGELETDDVLDMEQGGDDDDSFGEDDDDFNDRNDVLAGGGGGKNMSTTSSQIGERPQLSTQSSMFHLLADISAARQQTADDSSDSHEKPPSTYNLKPLIIQEINDEIIADLESVYKGIADQAVDYIHAK